MSDNTLAGALYGSSGPATAPVGPTAAPAPAATTPAPASTNTVGAALYPSGPAQSPLGPKNREPGEAYRGVPVDRLPQAASPDSVVPNAKLAAPQTAEPAAPTAEPAPQADIVLPPGMELPDGFSADPALFSEFTSAAADLRLPPEASNKLLAMHAKAMEAQSAELHRQSEAWAAESKAYFGDAINETAASIRDRIAGYGADGAAFLKAMNETKLGNNLSVLRVLDRLAKGR